MRASRGHGTEAGKEIGPWQGAGRPGLTYTPPRGRRLSCWGRLSSRPRCRAAISKPAFKRPAKGSRTPTERAAGTAGGGHSCRPSQSSARMIRPEPRARASRRNRILWGSMWVEFRCPCRAAKVKVFRGGFLPHAAATARKELLHGPGSRSPASGRYDQRPAAAQCFFAASAPGRPATVRRGG